jgi:hypothetical protein
MSDYNLAEAMQDVLNRFPADKQKDSDFLVSRYLFMNQTAEPGISIQFGQNLVREGHHTVSLYLVLAARLLQTGKKDAAESLIFNGVKRFPAEKSRFEDLKKAAGIG